MSPGLEISPLVEQNSKIEMSGVSICLLTYNHAHLIESTIKSILDQEFKNFEFIISDDCSDDDTWELIQDLACFDSRIRPLRTPHNLGMPGNANYAVNYSSHPYIALLHHDDFYDSRLLAEWVLVLDTYPEVGFVFNDYRYESGKVRGLRLDPNPLDGQNFLRKYLFANWGSPVRGTAMIRRSSWDAVGGMRERFNLLADVDLWMRLARHGAVGYVPEALITVRHHRPEKYPDIYHAASGWSWSRQRYLYDIHATNRLEYLPVNTVKGRFSWWWFRAYLSAETFKWLGYGVVRHKPQMILTSKEGATNYDLPPLTWIRLFLVWLYQKIFQEKSL